ncbi:MULTISPECIES: YadA C-terminal domain-containing protein [unclassified Acinetobacter]|uniref:YadA C-terminal domain-containing protein n=1 Tax=unclassified Acinetobacter TaxID=196816 RepID=UPI00211DB6B4|nr:MULTISPECIES: YadA C-terminal domain-containing protein [unclassified Acinetobacter]
MKFQKSLLAASLAVVAVSANAAVVSQQAIPVQVTEDLVNNKYINSDFGYAIYDANGTQVGVNGNVYAPVHGELATTYNNNVGYNTRVTSDYLPELSNLVNGANEIVGIDLGSQSVGNATGAGTAITYDVFKYKGADGATVYEFVNPKTGESSGYFTKQGDALVQYTQGVDVNTLTKGGQIAGVTGSTTTTGFENKVVNGEHVLYGYQGSNVLNAGGVNGVIVAPDGSGTEERVAGSFGDANVSATEVRYVQSGIIANTGSYSNGINGQDPYLDPSKNIYGVSARDNNNVTMLTGNGIALADLSNKGTLQTDGSVASSVLVKAEASGVQKTREYDVDGKRVLEIYNNDAGRELASKYYEITANGTDLVEWTGSTPVAGSHIKTGTAEYASGTYNASKVHNTVTNKNVTYSESVATLQQEQVKAGITTPGANTTDVNKTFSATPTTETSQSVSTGVIGKNADGSNKYGTEVVKTDANGTQKTEITASGINTTGVINAADYQIGGVSIVDNIKTSVDEAVGGATQAIDAKVAEVDSKIVEVDARLTQFNTTAANLNSRVDQLNSRVNEVEEKAYRGVAIALAAQQQIPNIGAGQFAVFGGVGHYEGESAGALGVASVFADGRTSLSAAIGVAGGSEVGGRVGLSYVFGGK